MSRNNLESIWKRSESIHCIFKWKNGSTFNQARLLMKQYYFKICNKTLIQIGDFTTCLVFNNTFYGVAAFP